MDVEVSSCEFDVLRHSQKLHITEHTKSDSRPSDLADQFCLGSRGSLGSSHHGGGSEPMNCGRT